MDSCLWDFVIVDTHWVVMRIEEHMVNLGLNGEGKLIAAAAAADDDDDVVVVVDVVVAVVVVVVAVVLVDSART